MSTPRIEDTLLQRLLDGDLAGREHDEVVAQLGESAPDRGRQQALERLSGFISTVMAEDAAQLSAAESSSLFDAVWAGIEVPARALEESTNADASADDSATLRQRPRLRLIEGEGLGTLPPRSEKVAFEPQLRLPDASRSSSAREEKPADEAGVRWPGILAVAALAAAAVLAIALRPSENNGAGQDAPVAQISPTLPTPPAPQVAVEDDPEVIVATHHGTEVEEVDFGSNIGTVFQVPGEQDVPLAVVWVSDEEYVR